MCSYLVDRLKLRSRRISPDATITIQVRYRPYAGIQLGMETTDTLMLRAKIEWIDQFWTEVPAANTQWSIFARRGL
jgi:hypothetical protein